jgi:DNA-binding IclR family transcriptional regulator
MLKAHSPRPTYAIGSVDSVLRLLRGFSQQSEIRISEAAESLGVAPSTAHRLLTMLVYHGFAVKDDRLRVYRPGPILHELGMSVIRDMDIRRHARPVLERLRDEVNESVNLAVPYGSQVLYVEGLESKNVLRVGTRAGTFVPANCISVGKVLLATLSTEQLLQAFPSEILPTITPNSVAKRAKLVKELKDVRARGYARSFGESEEGVCSVAVALRNQDGEARAAISIAAPISRHNVVKERMWVDAASRAARDIEAALWGSVTLPETSAGKRSVKRTPVPRKALA